MDPPITPLVVFIAHESTATGSQIVAEEWLLSSLKYVAEEHEENYSTIGWQAPIFLPFVHGANDPWVPGARHTKFMMTDVVARVKSLQSPVMLVVSGWSGITTCPLMWHKIFSWSSDAGIPVQVRIYAENPRRFFGMNPQQVRQVLRGDTAPGEEVALEGSTELFIRNFKRL